MYPFTPANHQYRHFFLIWIIQSLYIFIELLPLTKTSVELLFAASLAITQGGLLGLPIAILCRYVRGKTLHRETILAIASCLSILLLLGNYRLYDLYGFFFNDFVFNIVTTAGGIEALDITSSTWITLTLSIMVFFTVVFTINRWLPSERLFQKLGRKTTISILFVTWLFQSGTYALADYRSWTPELLIAEKVVWYIPMTSKGMLKKLGLARNREVREYTVDLGGKLNYQTSKNELHITRPYNVVWLVSESLRWDMLSAEIMPNTYAFADRSQHFLQHYSSGNGTRMGMFGMFYGIYGSYWFDFLKTRTPPLLLHTLRKNNYQMMAYTSAAFSYPEFDRTVFSEFSKSEMHEDNKGQPWKRDERNVTRLISSIKDATINNKPFFSFMFFESSHANYSFPETNTVRSDYSKDMDYLTTNFTKEISGIKARYVNSAHYLDSQFTRIFDYLEKSKLLENTIVLITGDHGEEFMENGYWGHNSTFSEQQTRVPLIIYSPDKKPQKYTGISSHLDLPATILKTVGITKNGETYSHGSNLFADNFDRDYVIISDWHGNAIITSDYKLVLSSKGRKHGDRISTKDDQFLNKLPAQASIKLKDFLQTLGRFYL
ncbi:sulfatase-like hydrolase/transferase [Oceanicoccus sp. KOV_DT_Chl]|uniref:sulfatase-like hydrolase/transferase n=1 Tax=Oceanicoccus sp. KOV_DT_Chl TaxID=1904639 RepID=UPI000C7ABB33|nr:sulfatase-like hydrolase/transferase [Oceanicoccus sp. KOV_DT_Chl]